MKLGLPAALLAALGCALLAPSLAASTPPAHAQQDSSNLDTQVVRTVSGNWVHFRITLLIPPPDPQIGPYRNIYLYGSIGDYNDKQFYIGPCWHVPECHGGFPVKAGPFTPGTRVVVETDLPRSFVEARNAHFHLGLGNDDSYIPSNDLLQTPPRTL